MKYESKPRSSSSSSSSSFANRTLSQGVEQRLSLRGADRGNVVALVAGGDRARVQREHHVRVFRVHRRMRITDGWIILDERHRPKIKRTDHRPMGIGREHVHQCTVR